VNSSKIAGRVKFAVSRCACGLNLNERETKALFNAIEEATMETQQPMNQKPACFDDAVDSVLKDLRNVMIAKQKDYGPRNILNCGEKGVAVRANDKMARLLNLHGISDGTFQTKAAKNESIDDSWTDLANYGIIALMVRRGIFDLPLKAS
jgi:hypothetical protein